MVDLNDGTLFYYGNNLELRSILGRHCHWSDDETNYAVKEITIRNKPTMDNQFYILSTTSEIIHSKEISLSSNVSTIIFYHVWNS